MSVFKENKKSLLLLTAIKVENNRHKVLYIKWGKFLITIIRHTTNHLQVKLRKQGIILSRGRVAQIAHKMVESQNAPAKNIVSRLQKELNHR